MKSVPWDKAFFGAVICKEVGCGTNAVHLDEEVALALLEFVAVGVRPNPVLRLFPGGGPQILGDGCPRGAVESLCPKKAVNGWYSAAGWWRRRGKVLGGVFHQGVGVVA